MKLHFTTDKYNIVETRGAVKVKQESFEKRKDVFTIRSLARNYKDRDAINFILANFVSGDQYGGLYNPRAKEIYLKWKSKQDQLLRNFENDLSDLQMNADADNIINPFSVEPGHHPYFIKCYLAQCISIETLVIINKINPYIEQLDESLKDDLIWPDVKRLIIKYSPFIKIKNDRDKYEKIYWERVNPVRN